MNKQYCTIHKRIARYLKNGNIWIILSFVYKAWIEFMTLLVIFEERTTSLSRQNRWKPPNLINLTWSSYLYGMHYL